MLAKAAFVLMPFAQEYNDVYEHLICNSLKDTGYNVKRADDIKNQRNIIMDIIESIIESDLIIADLTGSNPNVYYELGISHAFNKKVILITQELDDLPFDLRSYRVIGYSTHFTKIEQARKELRELAIAAFNEILIFGNPVNDYSSINHTSNLPTIIEESKGSDESDESDEDLGLIDYHVMVEDGFEALRNIILSVAEKMVNELTPEISKATDRLISVGQNTKQKQNVVMELSRHIQEYAAFVRPKNEEIKSILINVDNGLENVLSGKFEMNNDNATQDLASFMEASSIFKKAAMEGRQSFVSLIEVVESIPKIEKNFNRAKNSLVSELTSFVNNIDQAVAIIERAGRLGSSLVERLNKESNLN